MTRKTRRKRAREQEKLNRRIATVARPDAPRPIAPRAAAPWALVGTLVATSAFPRAARAHELGGRPGDRDERRAVATRAATAADARVASADQSGDVGARIQQFDIPPGPLKTVLGALRQTTGLTILLPEAAVGEIYSPGVSGRMTVRQALDAVIDGTSLTFTFAAPTLVRLDFRTDNESVTVTGFAPAAIGTPKFTETLRDTPQSIDVVPSEVLSQQGVTTLRDAVRNVAGISLAAGEGGAQGDNLTIRGFTARNDIFIDGMRDFGSYYRDPFNQEQVQVLKGPSSVAFGRGTTGGVLNQATKTPQHERFVGGTASFGTDMTRRATLDLNQPLGDNAAFRLNLMGTMSNVAGRDVAENGRVGVAPSLSLDLGSSTRLTVSYFHQSENDVPDYGIPWRFNEPAPVARDNYYGFADTNFLDTRADIAGVALDHQFGAAVTATNRVRYASYGRDAQISEARMPTDITPATPLETITVGRNQITVDSVETFFQDQFDVTSRFQTGAVGHTLVTGVEAGRETSDPIRSTFAGVPGTNLATPNPFQPFAGTPTVTSRVDARATTFGAYALDTLRLTDQFDVMAGVRWDRFDADVSQSVGTPTAFSRVDQQASWRGAVVYKPKASGSIYVDYGTSFNPSAEALSLSAATVSLPPESNRTLEAGSKWDLRGGRISARGAIFRTEKLNAREPDPQNSLLNVLSGTQRVNGVEGELTGRLTDRWQLMASYAFMDSALVKSIGFPAAVGSELANVPRHTFSVWSTCDLPWRLQAGGGGQYVGLRTASTTAPIDPTTGLVKALPGYWVGNAMVRRPVGPHLDAQLNVNNVTNAYFFDQLHPAHIVPGPGRSALLGLVFKF
ncbi:MAG TPA: TonB-dependent siderophore receptor [Vicinamibacterales bacterium]|nr:TonB-dependent siderophore receptor [Vicinamibacterales bacterium]